jgi:Family of unknown function (DUF6788)
MGNASSQLSPRSLPAPLRKVLESVPVLGGSLVKQYVVCGKPGCRCQGGQKHGPLYYLYWKEQGRSRSLYVPREKVGEMRQQIRNYRSLQKELARRVREGLRKWQRDLQKERRR